MSFTWKDTVATISMIVAVTLAISLTAGAFESIESRWALATFALLVLGGITGLITGTVKMMEHTWSIILLYVVTVAALTITVVNAFLNSQLWFMAMVIAYAVVWLEFLSVDLTTRTPRTPGLPRGGAA